MKKIASILLTLTLSLTFLTACGGGDGDTKASYDVNEVLNKINSSVAVSEAGDLNEEYLTIMMSMNKDDVKSYAGKVTQNGSQCADQIIVIEANDGKIDTVKQNLESYKESIVKSHENYPSIALDKAKEGRVVVKGNFAVLVIGGDESVSVSEAYKAVDTAIDEAFK